MPKTPRWYQQSAIDGIYGYFQLHDGNPLIVLPTGSGKSLVIAEFVRQIMASWPDQRVLVLTHVKELIEQNCLALFDQWPVAPAGIHSAGLNRRDVEHPVLFAGIQSVYTKAMRLGWFDLVLIDEAHLLPPGGEGQYRTYLTDLQAINPAVKVIGFTATPYRLGQGLLTEGDGRVFTDIAYDGTHHLLKMIEEGHLCRLIAKKTDTEYDLTDVAINRGEYVQNQLADAMDREHLTRAACQEITCAGADRKSWLIFASSVAHAHHVADTLADLGIDTATVTGKTPTRERDRILHTFKAGKLRAVVNMGVLTTGFDYPGIDLIALLRATKSPGLHVQMLGRGLRVSPGKTDCLILDFVGNVREHGPIDRVNPPKGKSVRLDPGESPIRTCPECQSLLHISVQVCPDCKYEFPPSEKMPHQSRAFDDAPISDGSHIKEIEITDVVYGKHEKPGKTPSLRVDYYAGYRRIVSEWVCLEHEGFAGKKAYRWWTARDPGGDPPPGTVDDAISILDHNPDYLLMPETLKISEQGRWPEIVSFGRLTRREEVPF